MKRISLDWSVSSPNQNFVVDTLVWQRTPVLCCLEIYSICNKVAFFRFFPYQNHTHAKLQLHVILRSSYICQAHLSSRTGIWPLPRRIVSPVPGRGCVWKWEPPAAANERSCLSARSTTPAEVMRRRQKKTCKPSLTPKSALPYIWDGRSPSSSDRFGR